MTNEEKIRIERSLSEWNWRQFYYGDTEPAGDRGLTADQIFEKHNYSGENYRYGDTNDKAKDAADSDAYNNTGTDNHRDIRNTEKDERGSYVKSSGSMDIDNDRVFMDQITSQIHEIGNLEAAALLTTIRNGENYIYKEILAKGQIRRNLETRKRIIITNEEKIAAALAEAKGINEFTSEDMETMKSIEKEIAAKKEILKNTKEKIKELKNRPKDFNTQFIDTKDLEQYQEEVEKDIHDRSNDIRRYKYKQQKTEENRNLRQKIDMLKAKQRAEGLTEEETKTLEESIKTYGRRYKIEHWLNLIKAKNQLIATYMQNEQERIEYFSKLNDIGYSKEDYEKERDNINKEKEDVKEKINKAEKERTEGNDPVKKALAEGRIKKLQEKQKNIVEKERENEEKRKILDMLPKFDKEAYEKIKNNINEQNKKLNEELAELGKSKVFKEPQYAKLLEQSNESFTKTFNAQMILDKDMEFLEQEKKRVKSTEEIIAINRMNAAKKRLMEAIALPAIKQGLKYMDNNNEANKEITFDSLADIYERIQKGLVTYQDAVTSGAGIYTVREGQLKEIDPKNRAVWTNYEKVINKNVKILKDPQVKEALAKRNITVHEGTFGYIRTMNEAASILSNNPSKALSYEETNKELNKIIKTKQLEELPKSKDKNGETFENGLNGTYIQAELKEFKKRAESIRRGETVISTTQLDLNKLMKEAESIKDRVDSKTLDNKEKLLYGHVSKMLEENKLNEIYNILKTEKAISSISNAIKKADEKPLSNTKGITQESGEKWMRKSVDFLNANYFHYNNYKLSQSVTFNTSKDITPADTNNIFRAIANNPAKTIMDPNNEKVTERMRESIKNAAARFNMPVEEYLEKAQEEIRIFNGKKNEDPEKWKGRDKDFNIEKTKEIYEKTHSQGADSLDIRVNNKDGQETEETELDRKKLQMIAGNIHSGESVVDYLERRQSEETGIAIKQLRAENLESILGGCTDEEKEIIKIHAKGEGIDTRSAAAALYKKPVKNITNEDILNYEDTLKSARRKVAYNCYEKNLISYSKLVEVTTINMNDKAKNDYLNNKYMEHQAEYDSMKAAIDKEFNEKKANILNKIKENKAWEKEKFTALNAVIDKDNKEIEQYRKELQTKNLNPESIDMLVDRKTDELNAITDKLITNYENEIETRKRYVTNLEKNALYNRNQKLNELSQKGNQLEEERKNLEIENFRYKTSEIKDLKESIKQDEALKKKDPEIEKAIDDKKFRLEQLQDELEYDNDKWNKWNHYKEMVKTQETEQNISQKDFDKRYEAEKQEHKDRVKEIKKLEKTIQEIEKSEGFDMNKYKELQKVETEIQEKKNIISHTSPNENTHTALNEEAKELKNHLAKKLDDKIQYEEDPKVSEYIKVKAEIESINQKFENDKKNNIGKEAVEARREHLEKTIKTLTEEKNSMIARQVPDYQKRADDLAKNISLLNEEKEKLGKEQFNKPLTKEEIKNMETRLNTLAEEEKKYKKDEIVNNYKKTLGTIETLKEKTKEVENNLAAAIQRNDHEVEVSKKASEELKQLEEKRSQLIKDTNLKELKAYKEKTEELADKKYQEERYAKTHLVGDEYEGKRHYNFNITKTVIGRKYAAARNRAKKDAERQVQEEKERALIEKKNEELRNYVFQKDMEMEMKKAEYRELYLKNMDADPSSMDDAAKRSYEENKKRMNEIEAEVKPYQEIRETLTRGTGTQEQRKYQSLEKQAEYLKNYFFKNTPGTPDDDGGHDEKAEKENSKSLAKAPKTQVKVNTKQAPIKIAKPQEKADKGRERQGYASGRGM